jgi:hypothetical protein
MRARRREINIFNMSLLDILCGALGAFCFMMLVALPYYKPPGHEKKLREAQEETNKLLHDIEKMKEHMGDQQSAEDFSELVRRLEAQIKILQGQVNQLSAENQELKQRVTRLETERNELLAQNQQLRAENQQLQAEKKELQDQNQKLQTEKKQLENENDHLKSLLAQKKPFMLVTTAAPNDQNIAIFLSDKMLTDDKRPSPNLTFNPESQQSSGWSDDRVASLPGRGTAIWVAGSVMADGAYKVYLKNTSVWFSRQATSLSTTLYAELPDGTKMASLPEVTLTRDRPWVLFGTITINGNYRPVFKVATPAEREAEWKLFATPTPTLTPRPSPTPPLSPTPPPKPLGPEAAEAQRKFMEALRHIHEVMSLPASEPGIEEKRRQAMKEMEEARKKMTEARQRELSTPLTPIPGSPQPRATFGPPLPSPAP